MAYSSGSLNLQEELDPKKEEKEGAVREVGDQAVWSLSSCKAGGVYFSNLLIIMKWTLK